MEPDSIAILDSRGLGMTALRVLHVIPSVATVRGGPSQAVIEMVRTLCARGVEATIATTNDNGADLLNVPLFKLVDYQGVPVRFFPRFSPQGLPGTAAVREFAFSYALTQWLWNNIKEYDLLHIHAIFSYPSTVAMAIARNRGIPYLVRPLGQLCEWSLQQSAFKKQLYLKLIEQTNLNHSQGLHFTSEQEEKEATKLQLGCPSFVIPHGLDFLPVLNNARQRLRAQFCLPANERIILFLSRIHPKKGLDYLIAALSNLMHYPFTFILAGSGDPAYEAEVQVLLKLSGLDIRTILPGFVRGETKALLLQGADLYALTSHSENFGVAVLEALAAGLPAIVTPGVALADEIRHHQLGYVSELDKDAIASTLAGYLENSEAAIHMGKQAQQFTLENYTWKRNADNLIKVYGAIFNQRPSV
jgi:glycosyltransferase involved in cell wall biosynthesis